MGLDTRPPTAAELDRMAGLVREAMEQGAVGLSSGLDYIPSRYATTEELIGLCRAIAPFGGVYVTHMRRYDPEGWSARWTRCSASAGRRAAASTSRTSTAGPNWSCPSLDAGRADGVDVTYDLYCYLAGSSILGMVALPPWVQEGGIEPTLARLRDPASARAAARVVRRSVRFRCDAMRLSYVSAPE